MTTLVGFASKAKPSSHLHIILIIIIMNIVIIINIRSEMVTKVQKQKDCTPLL